MPGGKVLENLEGFRKFQAKKPKKLNAIVKTEKEVGKTVKRKMDGEGTKTGQPRIDLFAVLKELKAMETTRAKPAAPAPLLPKESVISTPSISDAVTFFSPTTHVDDGAITISRDKNPVTGAPCFIIQQAFPNCLQQQIFVNDKSLPQFINFIINLLV
jgi:hypothetical protein